MSALIYSDSFWSAILVGSFLLLAVGVVLDLLKTKPRRIT